MICLDKILTNIGLILFIFAVILRIIFGNKLSNKYGYFKQFTAKKTTSEVRIVIFSWSIVFAALFLALVGSVLKFQLQKFNFCF